MLKKEDFVRVLKSTVKAEWDAILLALKRFEYFENFSKIDNRECCILSNIRLFTKGSIILGGSYGNANYMHFILKGKASILVQLTVEKNYTLNGRLIKNISYTNFKSEEIANIRKARHRR